MRDALFMESNGIDDMFPIRVLNTTAYAGIFIINYIIMYYRLM